MIKILSKGPGRPKLSTEIVEARFAAKLAKRVAKDQKKEAKTLEAEQRRQAYAARLLATKTRAAKRCPDCDTEKNRADFFSDRCQSDGISRLCKLCFTVRKKARRDAERIAAGRPSAAEIQEKARATRALETERLARASKEREEARAQRAEAQRLADEVSAKRREERQDPNWPTICRRRYWHKHKLKIAEARRRRYAERPEEVRAVHARRQRVRHVRKLATDISYRKRLRFHKNMRKARKKAATTKPVTAKFWAATLEVYRHRCAYCPSSGPLEMDHFRPLARGGSHAPHNVLPACRSCNVNKGARDPFAFLEQAPGRLFFGVEDARSPS